MVIVAAAATALFAALAGCGGGGSGANLNSKEAIRKAVVEHLSTRKGLDLDMSAMEVDIGDVSFRANDAEASVSFRAKGSKTSAMSMKYQLTRDGNQWKVKPKEPGEAGSGHGGAGAVELPAPLPGGAGATLPPGHPPVEAPKAGGGAGAKK